MGSPAVATAIAVVAVILLGVATWSALEERPTSLAESKVIGPECTALSGKMSASQSPFPHRSAVGGILLSWDRGDESCDVEGSPSQETFGSGDSVVCQFSSPGRIRVQTRTADYRFAAPDGKVASIIVAHGKPRCVLAAPDWENLTRVLSDDMHSPPGPSVDGR